MASSFFRDLLDQIVERGRALKAIRDMLLAADGQGALMLLEGLLRESAAVSD